MAVASLIVVVQGSIPPVVDGDTVTMLMLVILAAGVGWVWWRRK